MDERFQTAMVLATAGEDWIEKAFWKERTRDFLAILMLFFVYWPVSVLKILTIGAMGIGALAALICIGMIVSTPQKWELWLLLLLSAAGPAAFYWVLGKIEPTIKRLFPNQFVQVLYLLISSRGLVIVASYSKPLFLPWACIVGWQFTGDVMTLTSQVAIDYAAVDGQIATVHLDGEEYNQPLGEIIDVLNARIAER